MRRKALAVVLIASLMALMLGPLLTNLALPIMAQAQEDQGVVVDLDKEFKIQERFNECTDKACCEKVYNELDKEVKKRLEERWYEIDVLTFECYKTCAPLRPCCGGGKIICCAPEGGPCCYEKCEYCTNRGACLNCLKACDEKDRELRSGRSILILGQTFVLGTWYWPDRKLREAKDECISRVKKIGEEQVKAPCPFDCCPPSDEKYLEKTCKEGECINYKCVIKVVPKSCKTHDDCAQGQKCEDGECVDLCQGECIYTEDCAVTAPDMLNPTCINERCVEEEFFIVSFVPEKTELLADGSGVDLTLCVKTKDRETGALVGVEGEAVRFKVRKSYGEHFEYYGSLSLTEGTTDSTGCLKTIYKAPKIKDLEFKGAQAYVQAITKKGNPVAYIKILPVIRIIDITHSPKEQEEGGFVRITVAVADNLNREKKYIFKSKYSSFVKDGKQVGNSYSVTSRENTVSVGWQAPRGVSAIDVTMLPSLADLSKSAALGIAADTIISGANTRFSKTTVADKMGAASDYVNPGGVAGTPISIGFGVNSSAKAAGGTESGWAQFGYACTIFVDGAATFVGIVTAPLDLAPGVGIAKDAAISTVANGAKLWFIYTAETSKIAAVEEITVTYAIYVDVVDVESGKVVSSHHPVYVKAYLP